jgi:hypothetical protein
MAGKQGGISSYIGVCSDERNAWMIRKYILWLILLHFASDRKKSEMEIW